VKSRDGHSGELTALYDSDQVAINCIHKVELASPAGANRKKSPLSPEGVKQLENAA
jgi:hypothetical protein